MRSLATASLLIIALASADSRAGRWDDPRETPPMAVSLEDLSPEEQREFLQLLEFLEEYDEVIDIELELEKEDNETEPHSNSPVN